jgi:hypothetical protein
MASMSDIVERAFRLLGIKAEGEDLTADQSAAGITSLNAMMTGWRLAGLANHAIPAVSAGSEFPLPDEYHDAVAHMLAARLAPQYGVPVGFDLDEHRRALESAAFRLPTATIDRSILPRSRWVS